MKSIFLKSTPSRLAMKKLVIDISKNLNVILNAVKNLLISGINCRFFGRASFRMTITLVFRDALSLLFTFLLFNSCVDRISIEIPSGGDILVVDGLITDEPGPYTVELTRASKLDTDLNFRKFVSAKSVAIFDNLGNSEVLKEVEQGIYQTKPDGIRGVTGRAYYVRVEGRDGKTFESVPEMIKPVGEVDSVYYEAVSFQPIDAPTEYGFDVYMDSKGLPDSDNQLRWKFSAIYLVKTFPELHVVPIGEGFRADPLPCSSFIVNNGNILSVPGKSCDCCTCWVTQPEDKPHVSDNQFVSNGNFKRVKLGYVPVNNLYFYDKVMIEVKQLSLSLTAFDFWKNIQAQKEGTGSLFQPPSGVVRTNIFEKNGAEQAQGLFYAAGANKKVVFIVIPGTAAPAQVNNTCLSYKYATTQKPIYWQ